jgi:hypothetical protein
MSNLAIVRLSYDREIFLLIESDTYIPAKYVSEYSNTSLTNLEIEYLYNCLRDGSIKWKHLSQLKNSELVTA